MTSKQKIYLWIFLSLTGGVFLGYIFTLSYLIPKDLTAPVEIREDSNEYKYINPLIFSRTSKDFYLNEYKTLNNSLNSYIGNSNLNKNTTSVSVYLRDLNSGHWTGINENETYEPSSLLKVVLLITYLKDSEKDKNILYKKIYYKGPDFGGQYYKAKDSINPGYYSVIDLIKIMIINSDNIATEALIENNAKNFQDVYKDFRLPQPPADLSVKDYMSARSYSVIFRTLYNSTYLTRDLSELALDLLSKVDFVKGINNGLPKNIIVSHKFGEHTYEVYNNLIQDRELHDCGIVYYPEHPYLLCLMTKGEDFKKLENAISDISKIIYNYIDDKYKTNI